MVRIKGGSPVAVKTRRSSLFVKAMVVAAMPFAGTGFAHADTMLQAFAYAYENSPELNAARARLRAKDEGVPQALAGYRPSIILEASAGLRATRTNLGVGGITNSSPQPNSVNIELIQPLFDGFKTRSRVAQSEAAVLAGREALRNTEQGVLFKVAEAYMNVIASGEIRTLHRQEVKFLNRQLGISKARYNSGQSSKADLSQSRARVFAAKTSLNAAHGEYEAAFARYVQYVGKEPRNLKRPKSITEYISPTYKTLILRATDVNPAVLAAKHNLDVATYGVGVAKSGLFPKIEAYGSLSRQWDVGGAQRIDDSQIGVRAKISVYQGGATSSRIREAREKQSEAQLQLDLVRSQVKANARVSWADFVATRASKGTAASQAAAQKQALDGIIVEESVGQRGRIDILNAESELTYARINLVRSKAQNIIAGYGLLAVAGKLNARSLELGVALYEPKIHYQNVRDSWFGLRTVINN